MRRIGIVVAAAAVSLALVATGCGSTDKLAECPLAGSTKCGSTCVNLQEDQLNCGACGNACAAGLACTAGVCSATCAAPLTKCGTGATAVCADLTSDAANCGTCGHPCAAGQVCSSARCLDTTLVWTGPRVFTNCGKAGSQGPDQAGCDTAYAGTTLAAEVTVVGGIQEWTAPYTATYVIVALGAGGESAAPTFSGGAGAGTQGEFKLAAGRTLRILVGQMGAAAGKASNTGNGGGGGGTFVVDKGTGNVLLVAGGGGGTRSFTSQNGCPGRDTALGGAGSGSAGSGWVCGARAAGTEGTGGAITSPNCYGSAGGGFQTDGQNDISGGNIYGLGGSAFVNGGAGGTPGPASTNPADFGIGGFGGGGAGDGCFGGGGGGGYSGGDGGFIAGGGGTINNGANTFTAAGVNSGNGIAFIDLIAAP